MTTRKLCYVLVTTLLMTMTGCGGDFQDVQDVNESQTSQDVTGCELDCPDGSVNICPQQPCSVIGNSMNCNGTVTTCPSPPQCVPRTCGASCGQISDGCGHTLNCRSCGCRPGTHDCHDGTCVPAGGVCR
jgi:hypothetical protein